MKRKLLPCILISFLGVASILWGVMSTALGIIGKPATATVTNIRREGGERNDGRPGRYTYNISYTFTLPDGKEISGFTKKIGNAVYLKANGTGRISVKYFKAMPYINSSEQNSQLSTGQAILIGTGVLLIVQMNRKQKDSNKAVE